MVCMWYKDKFPDWYSTLDERRTNNVANRFTKKPILDRNVNDAGRLDGANNDDSIVHHNNRNSEVQRPETPKHVSQIQHKSIFTTDLSFSGNAHPDVNKTVSRDKHTSEVRMDTDSKDKAKSKQNLPNSATGFSIPSFVPEKSKSKNKSNSLSQAKVKPANQCSVTTRSQLPRSRSLSINRLINGRKPTTRQSAVDKRHNESWENQ